MLSLRDQQVFLYQPVTTVTNGRPTTTWTVRSDAPGWWWGRVIDTKGYMRYPAGLEESQNIALIALDDVAPIGTHDMVKIVGTLYKVLYLQQRRRLREIHAWVEFADAAQYSGIPLP